MKLPLRFVPTLAAFISLLVPALSAFGQNKTKASPPPAPLQSSAKPAQVIARLQERIPQLMKEGEVPEQK